MNDLKLKSLVVPLFLILRGILCFWNARVLLAIFDAKNSVLDGCFKFRRAEP